jgi:ribosome-associated translation inhibitor RaiA
VSAAAGTDVEVTVRGAVPREQVDGVRRRFLSLQRYVGAPLVGSRVTIREDQGRHSGHPFVADASTLFDGRLLAAHATGRTLRDAVDAVVERLLRQLHRVVGADIALRNEPRTIARALSELEHELAYRPEARLKPPERRAIVHRQTYSDHPQATLSAIADMLDLDEEFHLFRHVRTGEDVVVHRREDGRIGLIHPQGSILGDETDDVVVAGPSRYSGPLSLDTARAEMDVLNHRFLYFIDSADGRGKVLYLRHDGDYGLVEPE